MNTKQDDMKLNKDLRNEIEKIGKTKNLGYVLDLGFGYPYELIELLHCFNADKCIGIDMKSEKGVLANFMVCDQISHHISMPRNKIESLIKDDDTKIQFYNSYKLYTTLVLDKEPYSRSILIKRLDLHFEKSIQDYLKNENKFIPNYNVVIISKVLSHIDPNSTEDWEWVLDQLLSKLSDDGIIYLKLNSDDFKVDIDSTILSPFNKQRLDKVIRKLNLISNKTIRRDSDGNREFEIIGKKRN